MKDNSTLNRLPMMKDMLILLFLIQSVRSQSLDDLLGAGTLPETDRLTFSNTARWDAVHLKWLRHRPEFLPLDWKEKIVLPAPPDNSSDRTRAELKLLIEKKKDREARLPGIKNDLELANFRFGRFTYGKLTKEPDFAKTGALMKSMYSSVSCAIFTKKKQFNRARPTVVAAKLGIDLDAVIPNPGHPAYPSGHATGAFTIAFFLAELDPENGETYLADARRIAENREIAGVHYPSDSEAGRLLARQLVDAFLRDRSFRALLDMARAEWPNDK